MRLMILGILVCSSGFALGDEIVLKDGKKIEWVALRDLGDTLEVETKQGAKLTFKRSEVEKINLTPAAILPPLTGATFTFDKKRKMETVDLLAKVDIRKAIAGDWKYKDGVLTGAASTAMVSSRLTLGVKPPEEYDVSFTLERTGGAVGFFIGLVGGDRSFIFYIDAYKSNWSGPHMVDGKLEPMTNGLGVTGTVLKNGVPRLITVMVRKEALIVQVDKKDYFTWRADWGRVDVGGIGVGEKVLFLGMEPVSTYQVRGMIMSSPKE